MANILAFLKMKDVYVLGPPRPPRWIGEVRCITSPVERAREIEITDFVEENVRGRGRICLEFSEDDRPLYACIVEVPEEKKDLLIELPDVEMVYTQRIPRSTVRKYDPQLKLAARILDALREEYTSKLQPAPTPAMSGE